MHKNNAKAAVAYWALIDNGMSTKEANNFFHYKQSEESEWRDFIRFAPNFHANLEIRKKPVHWDLMQEYERNLKNNPGEAYNWEVAGIYEDEPKWTRLGVNGTRPIWSKLQMYRRNPLQRVNTTAWFTMDSMSIGAKVDLCNKYQPTYGYFNVKPVRVQPSQCGLYAVHLDDIVVCATHWRPATETPF